MMVASMYVTLIISFLGMALLGLAISEDDLISGDRKGAQNFSIAEAGVDKAIWNLRNSETDGGKGPTWTTAPPWVSVDEALATDAYHVVETVKNAFDEPIGEVAIVVQSGSTILERRITAVGREIGGSEKQKYVQAVVELVPGPGDLYSYAMYFDGDDSVRLKNLILNGGLYAQEDAQVRLTDVGITGDIFAHEGIEFFGTRNDVTGAMYTFQNITGTGTLYQHVSTTQAQNYNGGAHNSVFPELQMGSTYNRAWYRAEADIFFPADAATNTSANAGLVEFDADAGGNAMYTSACCGSGMLLDNYGNPFKYGAVFVAGDIEIRGTFGGAITFVAAGNVEGGGGKFVTTGAEAGRIYIGDRVKTAPDDSDNLDALDPDAGDGVGLVAADVGVVAVDNPSYVRAMVWALWEFFIDTADPGTTFPAAMEMHVAIMAAEEDIRVDGFGRNLEIYLDTGLTTKPPPGFPGTVGVEPEKKQWLELTPAS